MILHQFYLNCLAHASYLIGDEQTRTAAVVDPQRDVDQYLVFALDRSAADPYAVLTGDTLFVGDVGRPDLRVALGWSAADLGGLLYDSLRSKLLALPDDTLVYPAHGAGSLCGQALSKETFSTLGEQRRSNYALQQMSKAAFIDLVIADQPDPPAYFAYDGVLNSKQRPTLDEALARELN